MLKRYKRFLHQEKGVVSIEFAIIFPFLLLLFIFVLEFSRIMFIGSAMDLVATEATRRSAITEGSLVDYDAQLKQTLVQDVPLWPFLTTADDFHVNVTYCATIQDVINNNCDATLHDSHEIILFQLNYQYFAAFSSLFSHIIDSSLTKKTIVYREFK